MTSFDQQSAASCPIAIVGVGKIARDQHLPAIAASPSFTLAATVTHYDGVEGVPNFPGIAAMAAALPDIRAVSICTPPRGRLDLVRDAFASGLDVLLEKPPAATLNEAEAIVALAGASGRVLHVSWHSRMAAAVAPARAWLAGRTIGEIQITWKEDVRVWHPGQEWIWQPGIGVFDPGINALSVLTALLPDPPVVERSVLRFPANRPAPIAADLKLAGAGGEPIHVAFDFDQRERQSWDIAIKTDRGSLTLTDGGSRLAIDGEHVEVSGPGEYPRLYARFADLIAARSTDADIAPFRLVADAFMLGTREVVGPFSWDLPR